MRDSARYAIKIIFLVIGIIPYITRESSFMVVRSEDDEEAAAAQEQKSLTEQALKKLLILAMSNVVGDESKRSQDSSARPGSSDVEESETLRLKVSSDLEDLNVGTDSDKQVPSFVSLSHELNKRQSESSGQTNSVTSQSETNGGGREQGRYFHYVENNELIPSNNNSDSSKGSKASDYNDIFGQESASKSTVDSTVPAEKNPATKPAQKQQQHRPSLVDPSRVNIFSNQEIINDKKKSRKGSRYIHEEDLPEGISRPLYVPAVIRKTEEIVDPQEYYANLKEKHKRQQQRTGKVLPVQSKHGSSNNLNGGTKKNPGQIQTGANNNHSEAVSPASNPSLISYFFHHSPNSSSSTSPISSPRATQPQQGSYQNANSVNENTVATSITSSLTSLMRNDSNVSLSVKKPKIRTSHWKPDGSAKRCAGCSKDFNMLNRKHHCRNCGLIFCDQCLEHTVKLDANLNYKLFDAKDFINPKEHIEEIGYNYKSCARCHKEYKEFVRQKLTELAADGEVVNDKLLASKDDTKRVVVENPEDDGDYEWSTF